MERLLMLLQGVNVRTGFIVFQDGQDYELILVIVVGKSHLDSGPGY